MGLQRDPGFFWTPRFFLQVIALWENLWKVKRKTRKYFSPISECSGNFPGVFFFLGISTGLYKYAFFQIWFFRGFIPDLRVSDVNTKLQQKHWHNFNFIYIFSICKVVVIKWIKLIQIILGKEFSVYSDTVRIRNGLIFRVFSGIS